MKRTKTITIGTREVIVSEISTTHVLGLLRGEQTIINLPLTEALERVKELLPMALNVPIDELLKEEIYSDDLNALYEALQETNPAFFLTARALNLHGTLATAYHVFTENFFNKWLSSQKTGMA